MTVNPNCFLMLQIVNRSLCRNVGFSTLKESSCKVQYLDLMCVQNVSLIKNICGDCKFVDTQTKNPYSAVELLTARSDYGEAEQPNGPESFKPKSVLQRLILSLNFFKKR